jgi:hypothetical protein
MDCFGQVTKIFFEKACFIEKADHKQQKALT